MGLPLLSIQHNWRGSVLLPLSPPSKVALGVPLFTPRPTPSTFNFQEEHCFVLFGCLFSIGIDVAHGLAEPSPKPSPGH